MFLTIIAFIGFQEIVVILLITVLLFGPDKIPEIARGLGEGVRAMREATDNIKREVLDSAKELDVTQELKETQDDIQKEIDQAKEEIDKAIGPVQRKL
ncbi:MAG: twin-arginine translocase TatA/TatE family subunit [Weeksellaceae bacterium]|nr:twin-arginine translocase TatA/TatE family subunit [Weeksellaceae bacterium]